MPVLNNAVCKQKYKAIGKLNSDAQFSPLALCAGYMEGGKDSCGGGKLIYKKPAFARHTFRAQDNNEPLGFAEK